MGDYLQNLMRGFGYFLKALFTGSAVPRKMISRSDGKYYTPSQGIIDLAVQELGPIKIDNGFTRAGYVPESKDCDNAAIHDYHYLVNVILPRLCPEARGKGMACGMFSFRTDKGGRHRVAYVVSNKGKRTYIDTYNINGTIVRKLSKTEESGGFDLH